MVLFLILRQQSSQKEAFGSLWFMMTQNWFWIQIEYDSYMCADFRR